MARLNPLTLAEKITGRPMASSTRHFFKDSFLYSIANVLPRVMGSIVIWPVIAMLVSPDGYAIFSNYNFAITVLAILLSAQVELATARYYYEEKDDFPEFLCTQFLFTVALSSLMMIQCWIFRQYWANWLKMPVFVFIMAMLTAQALITHQVYFALLLARKRSVSYLNYSLARQVIYVGLVIVLLVAFVQWKLVITPQRYLGLVYANFLSTIPLAVIFLYFLIRMMRPAFRWKHLAYAFRFTLPNIPGALALTALNYFDRAYLSQHSMNLAGQYAFAYQIGMMVSMITTGIFSAYMPRFYESRNREQYDHIQTMFSRNLKLLLLAATGLILLSHPVASIIGHKNKSYFGSLPIIPIIVSSYIFMWLGQCYGLYVAFRRKFIFTQSATLVLAGVLNVVLILWLVPLFHYNVLVAALCTLIPYLIQWILVYLIARVFLKEKTVHFRGLVIPFLIYLAFAAFWCLYGYGKSF